MSTLKISTSKPKNWFNARREAQYPPPIPFKRTEWSKDTDDSSVSTFKLRTNPTEADSQIYELKVRTFRTGTVEEFILWKRDLQKVLEGQNVTRPANKFAMARRVLEGDPLAAFNKQASILLTENENTFESCMEALANHVFPALALSNQKQWFRRSDDMRKKNTMTTRNWMARLAEMNEMLSDFPPKFDNTQRFPDDEFKDMIEYGLPNSWRAIMNLHNFRPMAHTLTEIVEFCERIENSEQMNGIEYKNKNKKGTRSEADPRGSETTGALSHAKSSRGGKNKNKRERHTSYADSGGSDGCALHTKAVDHTTGECRVLLSQAGKMRAQWEAQPKSQNIQYKRQKYNNNNSNKGGNHKKDEGDFHTLLEKVERVKESLEKAIKQQQSTHGKRKKREDEKHVSFEEEEKEANGKPNGNFDPDSFLCELEQLSISDNDHDSESHE